MTTLLHDFEQRLAACMAEAKERLGERGTAREPAPGTQCATLLAAFRRGETLTVLTAIDKYRVFALSQRCGRGSDGLERLGWKIERGWLKLPSGKRVRTYRLGK